MISLWKKFRSGMTLAEMMITVMIAVIPLFVVGILLTSGQKQWNQGYNAAHKQIRLDADAVTVTLGSIGRKSNRNAYEIYFQSGDSFTRAEPASGKTVAIGEAVEFRYWDAVKPDKSMLDVTNTGTHYALFYVDDGNLMVDYGEVDSSGIGAINGSKRTIPDTTITLAQDVSDIKFSHETINGKGQGCVRIDLLLKDPEGETIRVTTATLLRNVWPR